ncbi:extracellular solute-binding protein [Streptomyces sp. PT12]|uniref:extracellular solute-binding protein n=1 Tax=Streptomyces sp. PT12 TaxID=1510197 RepID=UPI000DE41E93|nr:extracellular solute-binding protein [Streptomyces sp. PT12]RBM23328.1 ABC transporter substrate-binding protein [Streptomyces sp. PT12]
MSLPSPARGFSRRGLLRAGLAGTGALLATGSLASCASPAASTGASSLQVWDPFQGGDGMLMDEMIASVSSGPDGFTVDRTILEWGASYYTKLAMSAAGGRAADVAVLHLSRLAGYAPGGLLDPWDLDLLAEFGVTERDFTPAIWGRVQHEGRVYGIPLDTHPFIVFFNTDLADQAGLLDSDGQLAPLGSPEALIAAGEALAGASGGQGIVFGHVNDTAQNWRQFFGLYSQTGAEFTLPDGGTPRVDRDQAVRVASFIRELYGGGPNPGGLDYNGAMAAFMGGRAGMLMSGEWELPTLRESGIPLGAAPYPQVFEQPAAYADSHAFVLPRQERPDAERRREAHRYVASMIKDSLTWAGAGHIPAYQPVISQPGYAELTPQSSYAEAGEFVVLDPANWFAGAGSNFQNAMSQQLQSMLLGNSSAEQAVDRMISEARTLLDQPNPVA